MYKFIKTYHGYGFSVLLSFKQRQSVESRQNKQSFNYRHSILLFAMYKPRLYSSVLFIPCRRNDFSRCPWDNYINFCSGKDNTITKLNDQLCYLREYFWCGLLEHLVEKAT
mmetsp:Transcript_17593/g.20392  ORF Transcript_17593/g.20392 Transcript_17593/m.20392 type:complete len:111 (+) Transcript_17593:471-803(+)